jgi:hypothetical protein
MLRLLVMTAADFSTLTPNAVARLMGETSIHSGDSEPDHRRRARAKIELAAIRFRALVAATRNAIRLRRLGVGQWWADVVGIVSGTSRPSNRIEDVIRVFNAEREGFALYGESGRLLVTYTPARGEVTYHPFRGMSEADKEAMRRARAQLTPDGGPICLADGTVFQDIDEFIAHVEQADS